MNSNNSSLFTLMDLDDMKIIINVLEKDIPQIKTGKKAIVTIDAFPGREFRGTVVRLSEAVDLSTRTMDVEIDFRNTNRILKPGTFANVKLVKDNCHSRAQRQGNRMAPPEGDEPPT